MFTGTLISYSLASSLKRHLNVTHGGKTKEMSGEFWMEKGKVRTLATANYETLGGLRGHASKWLSSSIYILLRLPIHPPPFVADCLTASRFPSM